MSCPTRIDFTGGFTDVLPFREKQWVDHINLAINLLTKVVLTPREDTKVQIEDKNSKLIEEYNSYKSIRGKRFSLIRAAIEKLCPKKGLNLSIKVGAPIGAGLGASGSLSVALTAALLTYRGEIISANQRSDLAILAADIEHKSGVLGGLQDQFAAVIGGLNHFQFYGKKYSIQPLRLSVLFVKQLNKSLLILYPGGRRHSTDIVSEVMSAYQSGNVKVSLALETLNALAIEIKASLQTHDLEKLSGLLEKVGNEQLKLHSKLADAGNRKIINELKEEGVRGIKLLGGGGAGACILTVCIDEISQKIVQKVAQKHDVVTIPVQIAEDGMEIK